MSPCLALVLSLCVSVSLSLDDHGDKDDHGNDDDDGNGYAQLFTILVHVPRKQLMLWRSM